MIRRPPRAQRPTHALSLHGKLLGRIDILVGTSPAEGWIISPPRPVQTLGHPSSSFAFDIGRVVFDQSESKAPDNVGRTSHVLYTEIGKLLFTGHPGRPREGAEPRHGVEQRQIGSGAFRCPRALLAHLDTETLQ